MGMQDVIRLSDIVLPNGVSTVGDPDLVVVTVLETKTEEAAPAAAAAAEGAATATPDAGAAPAGDAKPSA
jgi:hypothetical protein